MIDLLVQRVLDHWNNLGITPVPALSRVEISSLQARVGLEIPHDMLALYLHANGMPVGEYDDRNLRFWQIGELAEYISVDASATRYGGFADFLIMSHVYQIRLKTGLSAEVRIEGHAPITVASSFTEFLRLYLDEPGRLYT